MSINPIKIAISGKSRAGKDTIANMLKEYAPNDSFEVLSFAKPLYSCAEAVQKILSKPVEKDPVLMQLMGDTLRKKYGQDVFVELLMAEMNSLQSRNVIISDLRYKKEYDALKRRGFIMLRVNRRSRPIDRDPHHTSEIDLDDMVFDYVINNDGTLDDLQKEVAKFAAEFKLF